MKVLGGNWNGQHPDTRIEANPECLRVKTKIFQIEIAIGASGLSEHKYVLQLLHNRETDTRVGILVVPDPRMKTRFIRKFHDVSLFLFACDEKQNTCRGVLSLGFNDVANSRRSRHYNVRFMGLEWISISYD